MYAYTITTIKEQINTHKSNQITNKYTKYLMTRPSSTAPGPRPDAAGVIACKNKTKRSGFRVGGLGFGFKAVGFLL